MKLSERLKVATEYLVSVLKLYAPKDTGNLSMLGIRASYVSDNHWVIQIGGEMWNYALFTNEPWLSPRWNGKQNPNEGWVQAAIAVATPMIQQIMSGVITEDDVVRSIEKNDKQFYKQIINNFYRRYGKEGVR